MSSDAISKVLYDFHSRFSTCISDLRHCSFDSDYNNHQGYTLVDSKYKCYNFDKISEIICKQHGYTKLQSSDSVLPILPIHTNKLYLIEFKNSRSKIPWADIRAKILNSLFLFENFYDISKSDFKNIVTITVVHKSMNKQYLRKLKQHQGRLSGSEEFKVEHFKILEDFYGVKSLKYDSEKFVEFVENNGLAVR